MEKGDLSYRINGCAMTVQSKLKRGCMEYVYCRALAIELRRANILFEREIWLPIHYENFRIAYRRCDFLCENAVLLEIKAKGALGKEDLVQTLNMLEILNLRDGLLLNFGSDKLEYHHIFNNKIRSQSEFSDVTADMVGEGDEDLFESRHYLPAWMVERQQREKMRRKKD